MCDIAELMQTLKRLSPHIAVENDFWSTHEIALLLKKSESSIRNHIIHIPGFPPAYRLPGRKTPGKPRGKTNPLWRAEEVLAWVEKYRDKN